MNKKPTIEIKFKYISCEELADSQEEEPKAGDEASSLYFLDNPIGQGKFKQAAAVFGEALQLSNLGEIVEQVTDIECILISSIQPDKNDPDKVYLNIKEIAVV